MDFGRHCLEVSEYNCIKYKDRGGNRGAMSNRGGEGEGDISSSFAHKKFTPLDEKLVGVRLNLCSLLCSSHVHSFQILSIFSVDILFNASHFSESMNVFNHPGESRSIKLIY